MVNHAPINPTPVETNESQLPNYTEDQPPGFDPNEYEHPGNSSFRKKTISWHSLIVVMLAITLIMTSLQVYQYKEYGKALAKEAYVISVSINLMEDSLMFKYGVLPEDIGFEDLRSAWIENPCHETSTAYYNALKDALDYFDNGQKPPQALTPIKV